MQNWLQIKQLRLLRGSPHFVTIRSLAATRRSMYCHNSSLPPPSYFLFTTHDSAIEEISETALIQPSLALAPSLALCYAMLCFWSTDIVVKQTGREGCLHTVEIQTENSV